jgi:5,5'-dehydrodivanillate O-demethylase
MDQFETAAGDVETLAPEGRSKLDIDIATTAPGTPGGIFMRQFWHAVARSIDVVPGRTLPLEIMSEKYALFRGENGQAQIIAHRCPHRGAPMHLGWVEGDEIRCIYHGWKFDCSGQCTEQPAENEGFARKVRIKTYPTREFMGMIYGYFGEGDAPAFPPYPAPEREGFFDVWNKETVPCNYLQCFENSMDEVHVSFVHRDGGTHANMQDLPIITAEERDWGMVRFGTRAHGGVRVTIHYAPNCTRVIVPPMVGMDGVGGWTQIYFHFTPINDTSNLWLISSFVELTGDEEKAYWAKREEYFDKIAKARASGDVADDLMAGRQRYQDVVHPDLAVVQDIAVQAGQGAIEDRNDEWLGRSDVGIIEWRKILSRELKLIAEGKPAKKWSPPGADVVPELGF